MKPCHRVTACRLSPVRAAAAALLAVGVLLRAWHLGGPDFGFDEFYHVFAAKSLLAGGGFEVAEGRPYDRASLVTVLVAAAFALFGEGEAQARLPTLACGAALLVGVYRVGRRLLGPAAALLALALAALSPDLIDVSRFARLYSPLALASLGAVAWGFAGLEAALARPPRPRAAAAGLAAAGVAFAVALHLHPVVLGLGVAVHLYLAIVASGLALTGRRREAAPYALLALLLAVVEAALAASPAVRSAIRAVAFTPLQWYGDDAAGAATYHYYLAWQYGWLWYLVWPATVVAVIRRPRAGLFLALAFWVPLILLSTLVATRAPRYVSHLLPLAWLLLGGGLAAAIEAGWTALRERLASLLPGEDARRRGLRLAIAGTVLGAALLPLLRVSPSVRAATARPSRTVGAFTTGHFAAWRDAAAAVRPHLGPDTTVVTSVPLASRYYFGRPAVRLLGAGRPQAPWRDVGRTVVQDASDLAALRARGDLVVAVESWRWDTPGKLDDGLRSTLARACRTIDLPPRTGLAAFACEAAGPVRSRSGSDP